MKTTLLASWAALALALPAGAAEPVEGPAQVGIDHAVPAVSQAFEIGIGGGYFQGAGDVGAGMDRVQDLSGPGGGVELQLGYRLIPELAFGAFVTYTQNDKGDNMLVAGHTHTATAGLFGAWHFRPARSIDPWIGLSTGWRAFWMVPDKGENTVLQGLELARLQVGLDYRITPQVAIAPVLGASMSIFLTQDVPGPTGYENIGSPKPNFFFFGGLQARFDLFGTTAATPSTLASTR